MIRCSMPPASSAQPCSPAAMTAYTWCISQRYWSQRRHVTTAATHTTTAATAPILRSGSRGNFERVYSRGIGMAEFTYVVEWRRLRVTRHYPLPLRDAGGSDTAP